MVNVKQYLATMTEQNLATLLEQDTGPIATDQNTALSHQDAPRDSATSMTLNDGVSTTEWTCGI